ncbi:DUF6368 family protein [Nannocystis punicea]|uniref:DUF6368 family protein n=1 Tax=Nannocystis punicea TaxID=2995304 RepID=A0ABY7GWJ7_9BACT|nr:DUF6368 family protein [Nannocystis poenicansa]WAS91194.1 DUF6368 family protein [Nannocystis poenicansa]
MSGPSASVLVFEPLGPAELDAFQAMLTALGSKRTGDRFWVRDALVLGDSPGEASEAEERPFSAFVGRFPGETYDSEQIDFILRVFGRPAHVIDLVAFAGDPRDHRILGELCRRTTERLGGVVDFLGALRLPLAERTALTERGLVEDPDGGDFGDAAFMGAWLAHPSFHMIK